MDKIMVTVVGGLMLCSVVDKSLGIHPGYSHFVSSGLYALWGAATGFVTYRHRLDLKKIQEQQ